MIRFAHRTHPKTTDRKVRAGGFAAPKSCAPEPCAADLERLGDEIAELSAHLHAATYRLLVLVARFDRIFHEVGGGLGFRSTAHWLSWRTGVGPGAAREKVRVARALEDLPGISAAMERGAVSYSKARALTRVATPENEGDLLDFALHATAAHLERLVRGWRQLDRLADPDFEAARHRARYLRLHPTDDGSWALRGRLEPEVGALLRQALAAAQDHLFRKGARCPVDGEGGGAGEGGTESGAGHAGIDDTSPEQRQADLLGLLLEWSLDSLLGGGDGTPAARTGGAGTERFQVVVHVDANTLGVGTPGSASANSDTLGVNMAGATSPPIHTSGHPEGVSAETLHAGETRETARNRHAGHARQTAETSHTECPLDAAASGGAGQRSAPAFGILQSSHVLLGPRTVRRLACDARRIVMVHDADGSILDVGRRTRQVPLRLRRALEARDRECRFPGCGLRFTDAHHIVHWADGGETRLDNLVLLCRRHHRAVHEEGFRVEWVEDDAGEAERLRFVRPDGRELPEAPPLPAAPPNPVAAFAIRDAELGIHVDPWTPTPDWHGEVFDSGLALQMMWRR